MISGCYAIHLFDGHTVWTPESKTWALAIRDNAPIGMASLCRVEGYDCLWISDLFVVEECRRHKIATMLVAKLENEAQRRGESTCAVGIDEKNAASLQLFEKRGYVEYHRSPVGDVNVVWLSRKFELPPKRPIPPTIVGVREGSTIPS